MRSKTEVFMITGPESTSEYSDMARKYLEEIGIELDGEFAFDTQEASDLEIFTKGNFWGKINPFPSTAESRPSVEDMCYPWLIILDPKDKGDTGVTCLAKPDGEELRHWLSALLTA